MKLELVATCLFGLEKLLGEEIDALGLRRLETMDGRVIFEGDFADVARCNLCLRCAEHVFIRIGSHRALSYAELFDGVREWFSMINSYGKERGVRIEHYINSSGLAEMIEGTDIAHEFKRIFACSFIYNKDGEAEWPGVAVDYTAKTQFLFKINKGILSVRDNKKVNESQAEDIKRIPFPHMIYFGDGETDVPCMKIVKMFGGNSIAVYNPEIKKKVNVARKLLRQSRVNFITPAVYTKDSRTYQIVCAIIDKIRIDFELAKLSRH